MGNLDLGHVLSIWEPGDRNAKRGSTHFSPCTRKHAVSQGNNYKKKLEVSGYIECLDPSKNFFKPSCYRIKQKHINNLNSKYTVTADPYSVFTTCQK